MDFYHLKYIARNRLPDMHCKYFDDHSFHTRIFSQISRPMEICRSCSSSTMSYLEMIVCIRMSFAIYPWLTTSPDSKVHVANMGPTWVLSAPDVPHVGPINLAIRETSNAIRETSGVMKYGARLCEIQFYDLCIPSFHRDDCILRNITRDPFTSRTTVRCR